MNLDRPFSVIEDRVCPTDRIGLVVQPLQYTGSDLDKGFPSFRVLISYWLATLFGRPGYRIIRLWIIAVDPLTEEGMSVQRNTSHNARPVEPGCLIIAPRPVRQHHHCIHSTIRDPHMRMIGMGDILTSR